MAKMAVTTITSTDRINDLTDQAMECRDLQHAWPRRNLKQHAKFITFEITEYIGGHASAARRVMDCTGGCGVAKTQRFRITRDGRMQLDGKPRYSYPESGYRLKRPEQGTRVEPLDRSELRYTLLHRLYPKLQW